MFASKFQLAIPLTTRSAQGIHASTSAFEKLRQRPYGTEILCNYAAVDEGLENWIRLSWHLNDISFHSLPVGMKVVMRLDIYIRELGASLGIEKFFIEKKPRPK